MAIPMESAKAFVASSFGYEFENNDLLIEALDTTGMRKRESNQRLALMGDKILAFLVTDTWYPTGAPKGAGQNQINDICCNANLAQVAKDIGLGTHVAVHAGQRNASDKLLATTMEALFAAVYLDSDKDIDAVKFAMSRLSMTTSMRLLDLDTAYGA